MMAFALFSWEHGREGGAEVSEVVQVTSREAEDRLGNGSRRTEARGGRTSTTKEG